MMQHDQVCSLSLTAHTSAYTHTQIVGRSLLMRLVQFNT